MKKIIEHLRNNGEGVFESEELNEVILTLYNIIRWAVRDNADILIFYPTYIVWMKDNEVKGETRIDSIHPTVSFLKSLEIILMRDKIVRNILTETSRTKEKVIYQITE